MTVIDLLNRMAYGCDVPEKIKFNNILYTHSTCGDDYFSFMTNEWLFRHIDTSILNEEIEIVNEDDEEDLPPIPEDELYEFNMRNKLLDLDKINYNFKVLKEKVNQIVEELNKRGK